MSVYPVNVNGQRFNVQLPARLTFAKPLTDGQALEAVATMVANALAPHIRSLDGVKQVERDASGKLARVVERLPISGKMLALQAGAEVAHRYLKEADG